MPINIDHSTNSISALTGNLTFAMDSAVIVPSGTTGQRPTPVAGMIRYNSTTGKLEGYKATWESVVQSGDIGVTVQGYTTVLANTTASYTTTEETKLSGIATGANLYVHPSDGVDPGAALTGANVFSDITVNAAGHVTGSATRAITGSDIGINKAYIDALNVDADTIDSLNSTVFVRSDIDDFVGGVLSFNSAFSLSTGNLQTSTVTQTTLTIFSKILYSSGKFLIQATDTVTSEVHATEMLVIHDGTTASATEYGIVHTGASPLATYDVSVSGNDILVLTTSASASLTDYKVTEILVFAYSAGP